MTTTSDSENTGQAFGVLLGDLLESILQNASDPGACATQVTSQIRELVGVRMVGLVSADRQGAEHTVQAVCPPRHEAEWKRPEIRRFIASAAACATPRFIDPATDPEGRELKAAGIGPSFVVPLAVGADRLGLLVLLGLMDSKGAAVILEALTRVSGVIALIIRNAFLYKNMEHNVEQRTSELALHARISDIFANVSDDEMFNKVLNIVLEMMDSPLGVFGFIDEAGALVVPTLTRQAWDKCRVPDKTLRFPRETWGRSSWPCAVNEKRVVFANEPSTNIPKGHVGVRRHVSLPIILQGKVIGLLQVANKETDYTAEDLRILQTIAAHVAPLLGSRLQRRQAEKSLQESEEKFRLISMLSPVGIYLTSPEGECTFVNDFWCSLAGLSPEEALGKGWVRGIHPADRERVLAGWERMVASQGQWGMEYRFQSREGKTTWVYGVASPQRDTAGKIVAYLGANVDITELRQTQASLRRSDERHRTILQTAMDGFWLVDSQGRLLEVNEAYCQMSGYSPQELLAMGISDLEDAESREVAATHLEKVAAKGTDRFETRHRRKDGSVFNVEVSVQFRPGEAGRYVVFLRDITKEVQSAAENARLEEQLRQSQKVEAIGRLAGGVAHDFNNITAIILGYGEMLLGRLRPEDPLHKFAEQIVEAGRRSAGLTRQLLAFSRKQTLQPEVLDLSALLRDYETLLGRLIGEDVELQLKLAPDLSRILADPGQIEQVVTNLAINARDAMPRGGRLTIETADVELDEMYAAGHQDVVPGRYVMLALADTGCGMDRATLSRLFEPFFTTKERGKGTGLGLATAFGIVKQSGGYIWAYSEPGEGTCFKIYLPRTDLQIEPKPDESSGAEIPRGGGELILLVEDETALRELCAAVLTRLGYRVSAAGNGPEALRLLREEGLEPDLVLTDVIMPGMGGAELAERLRRERPGLKVLYMSGYPDDAISSHGVLDPDIPFLQKPFMERVLALKLREVLGESAAAARPGLSVLMIDDDEQYRELVRHFCAKRGHLCTGVDSAAGALAELARQSFAVQLVDLNIPGTSGEQVLREIRAAGHAAPAIVLTGDAASANMDLLRPLGVVRAMEKSGNAEPLLQAIEAAGSGRKLPEGLHTARDQVK